MSNTNLNLELSKLEEQIIAAEDSLLDREDFAEKLKREKSLKAIEDYLSGELNTAMDAVMVQCQHLQTLSDEYPDDGRISALMKRHAISGHRLFTIAQKLGDVVD